MVCPDDRYPGLAAVCVAELSQQLQPRGCASALDKAMGDTFSSNGVARWNPVSAVPNLNADLFDSARGEQG